ncbi:MAG: hypothetical protein RR435_06475 [Erysipelotrichaceae bacterium]
MKKNLNKKTLATIITIIMTLIISILTIILAIKAPITKENLSYIANQLGYNKLFIIWGLIVGTYFFYIIINISNTTKVINTKIKISSTIILILEVLGLVVPYKPTTNIILSELHSNSALIATTGFAMLTYYLLYLLSLRGHNKYIKTYNLIIMLNVFIFLYYGHITSLLELSYTLCMLIYLSYINIKTLKEEE